MAYQRGNNYNRGRNSNYGRSNRGNSNYNRGGNQGGNRRPQQRKPQQQQGGGGLQFFSGVWSVEGSEKVFAKAVLEIDRLQDALDAAKAETEVDGKIQLIILYGDDRADYWAALSGAANWENADTEDNRGKQRQQRQQPQQRNKPQWSSKQQNPTADDTSAADDAPAEDGVEGWDE